MLEEYINLSQFRSQNNLLEKTRFADLEFDTIIGENHKGALLTMNDRATGLVFIIKLMGK